MSARNAVLVITRQISPSAQSLKVALARTTINPTLTHQTAHTPRAWSAFEGQLRPFSCSSAQSNQFRRQRSLLPSNTTASQLVNGHQFTTVFGSRRALSSTARNLKEKSDNGNDNKGNKKGDNKGDNKTDSPDGKDSGSGSGSSGSSGSSSSEGGSGASSGSNGSSSSGGKGDRKITKFTFEVGSGGPSTNILENSLAKPAIPEVYPQVLTLPIGRRPLFPGFYKAVVIKNPAVANAIKELMKRGQPYVGAFLLKDEDLDVDTVTSLDQIHKVGVFAQITTIFPASAGSDEGSITAVLYPHRRIKIKELLPPLIMPDGTEVPREGVFVKESGEASTSSTAEKTQAVIKGTEQEVSKETTTTTAVTKTLSGAESTVIDGTTVAGEEGASSSDAATHLPTAFLAKEYAVTLSNVENMVDEPYNRKNQVIRAITSEIVAVFKDIASLNPLFRDQIANFSMSQSAGNVFEEPAKLADFATAVSQGDPEELQSVLESLTIEDRMQKALLVLKKELMNAQLQSKISKDVENKIAKRQREYYLMEQLKGIKKELGIESDGKDKLIEKFREKGVKLAMPEQAKKVFEEVSRHSEYCISESSWEH